MPVTPTRVEMNDVRRLLEASANQITFLNTAIIGMCDGPAASIGQDELMGLQTILFRIESEIRGAGECLEENWPRLVPQESLCPHRHTGGTAPDGPKEPEKQNGDSEASGSRLSFDQLEVVSSVLYKTGREK